MMLEKMLMDKWTLLAVEDSQEESIYLISSWLKCLEVVVGLEGDSEVEEDPMDDREEVILMDQVVVMAIVIVKGLTVLSISKSRL